jgi:uncharacterized protein
MNEGVVDTDVLMRLLTGDDLAKQRAVHALFQQVARGDLILCAPDTVIADAVFVLSSRTLYRRSREEIRTLLRPLLLLPGFKVQNKLLVLRALDIYAGMNIDFGDAMIAAYAERRGQPILYSYDHDFDRVPGVRRLEP